MIEIFYRDMNFHKHHTEFLEMKNKLSEMKNTQDEIKNRSDIQKDSVFLKTVIGTVQNKREVKT